MRIASLLSLLLISITAGAQGILGRWATYDDETGRKRSIVEISERGGKVFGHIRQLFRDPGEDPDPTCTKCDADDDRHNKRVIGMEIIRGLVRDGEEWADGTVLEPNYGSVHERGPWRQNDQLKVRGQVTSF